MEILSTRSISTNSPESYQELDIKKFTPTELAIHSAKTGTNFKQMSYSKQYEEAAKIWSFIKLKWGLRDIDSNDEKASIFNIMDDLMSKPLMTPSDVYLCLKSAMEGKYGESNFFNSQKFRLWLAKYNDESQIIYGRVQLAINAANEKPKPLPTEQEQKALTIQNVNMYIQKVKEATDKDTVYPWIGGLNFLYDDVNRFGFIKFTPERKQEIFAKCNNDIDLAKAEAYKLWISELAELGVSLDENGEMV